MGLWSRLLGRSVEQRGASLDFGPGWGGLAAMSAAGGVVSPRAAENLSTVVACVNAISSGLASLPVRVYRAEDDGRVEAPNHPVSRLLRSPNPRQTWPDFAEFVMSQVLLWGNALAAIERDGAGRPTALVPIPWAWVAVQVLPSGRLAYDVVMTAAPYGGPALSRRYLEGEVLHLRDRSDDGIVGRSRISRAPDVIAAATGVQTHSSAVWQNGAAPSGLVTTAVVGQGQPAKDEFRRFKAQFTSNNVGAHNAGRVIFGDAETKFTPMSLSPEDSEVLASRQFSVYELCRLFNVPPPIVQSYEFNSFTNAAQASTWFAQNSLAPWARKLEAEFSRSVFTDPAYHIEIDLSGLVRGDYATRWTANVAAVGAKILTADEVREAEGYGPLADAAAEDDDTGSGSVPDPGAT